MQSKIQIISTESEDASSHQTQAENEGSTFENAVTLTGFGKFNVILILVIIPGIWAPIFETTTMSYSFAAAHCDLKLSLEDKGYLNSITYLGMVLSAPVWGFLFDTLGRRKLLIGGYLLDALFVFISAFTQSFIPLMICKFFGGLIINGPYAAMITYVSEFHCFKYRPRIQLVIGTMNSLGSVALPLLAWWILPLALDLSFLNGYIKLHSWNVYLLICGLPAFYSGIAFLFLPESPKFLMTIGENEKALTVFQKVYSINTGKPADSFPIKQLVDETKINDDNKHGGHVTANRTKVQALKEGWQQITPLFYSPLVSKLFLVCFIQLCVIQSHNMIRLWTPQIFQAIDDYEHYYNGSSASLCTMLELLKPTPVSEECVVNLNNSKVYINSIIVAAVTMLGFGLTGFVINILGKKKLMIIFGFLAGVISCLLYLSQNTFTTVALSSIFTTLTSIYSYVVLAAIVDLFPTTLRTLTVALTMMMARAGAMCGNLLFPVLLRLGCEPPFFYIGVTIIVSAIFCFLMPNTDNKPLK
ncbi:synaptic vesicle glycoprotein 2B-like [Anoplophora glabripennis]|uniref:synaptic vesicle glycoprotein 2B-like n=1 Tax=Anoplophora glabripennis TaxID=217634 RepID=UPI000873D80A|nr:synaptic vesicle glycoprotein 2B-like [Anoplophora glabripennis]